MSVGVPGTWQVLNTCLWSEQMSQYTGDRNYKAFYKYLITSNYAYLSFSQLKETEEYVFAQCLGCAGHSAFRLVPDLNIFCYTLPAFGRLN